MIYVDKMTDHLSCELRSKNMSNIRSKDTKPEMLVRKALHAKGFRYRLHNKMLPGTPDLVLSKYKTIIEIKGCFWHGHNCKRGNLPKSNLTYWNSKISNNIERDKHNEKQLILMGWKVITVWECECTPQEILKNTIDKIEKKLI